MRIIGNVQFNNSTELLTIFNLRDFSQLLVVFPPTWKYIGHVFQAIDVSYYSVIIWLALTRDDMSIAMTSNRHKWSRRIIINRLRDQITLIGLCQDILRKKRNLQRNWSTCNVNACENLE